MGFKESEIDDLLVGCNRRCCICHRFCGFKMEVHHIKFKSNGGSDEIENAIPLCFECHAEVACYNPNHPKGKKYSDNELLKHKNHWIGICKNTPSILVGTVNNSNVGPLEGMILELEFNTQVAKLADGAFPEERIGCSLRTNQYEKAITEGAIWLLPEAVREKINNAFIQIGRCNNLISTMISTGPGGSSFSAAQNAVFVSLRKNVGVIGEALLSLKDFLRNK